MEYVGSVGPDGYDEVVAPRRPGRPDVHARSGSSDGRVLAGMHVNDWDAIDHVRGIVGARHTSHRLGDEDVPLAELAAG